MDFPSALREWRKERGLSQRALVAMIGVCQSAIYRYESGKVKPSPETASVLIELDFPPELIQYGGHYKRTAKSALTDEERAFAEKNHKLVYSYLNSRRLSENDWYDVVIFGYLHAVQVWFRRPELRKYKFSVIAYRTMRDAVKQERKKTHRNPPVTYIYDFIPGTDGITYADIICDPRDCVGI